jgi:hypothetical protein
MKNGVFWVVLTRATRRNNPEDTILHMNRVYFSEDGILHIHRHENLKSYIALTG